MVHVHGKDPLSKIVIKALFTIKYDGINLMLLLGLGSIFCLIPNHVVVKEVSFVLNASI